MIRQTLPKTVLIFLLIGLFGMLVGCSSASTNAQGTNSTPSPTPNVLGDINGPFTATVLQGPDQNTSLKGTLKLQLSSNGSLSGTLTDITEGPAPKGQSVPVTGQIKGQLIGLYFALGSGKNIYGSGVIGYDQTQKKNTIGGTFSGPDETSSGVWTYGQTTSAGGCIQGILYYDRRPGVGYVCYIID